MSRPRAASTCRSTASPQDYVTQAEQRFSGLADRQYSGFVFFVSVDIAMYRLLFALIIAVTATAGSLPAAAQNNQRTYAPENIGSLPVTDQIRVIEKEYREQSRGREIPDDQLDFYLDQIRYSRWTFSRIRNDIAVSLRGNSGGSAWYPPPGGTWNPASVICSSKDRRYNECRTPFRGRPRLVENISDTRCVEGQNWGSRQGLIWVNRGCRGRFIDSGSGWGGSGNNGQTFRCESDSGRYRECRKPYSGGNTVLVRQLSSSRCTEGYSWGEKRDYVWVSNGCRGEFQVRGGGSGGGWNNGYSVTCSSYDGAYKTCSWDRKRGTPQLLQRISGRCEYRSDWGYNSNSIWVKNGCSARFGTR
jgi:hypothetical protein